MQSRKKRANPSEKSSQFARWVLPFLLCLLLAAGLGAGLCALAAHAMCTTDFAPAVLIPLTTFLVCIAVLIASMLLSAMCRGGILLGTLLAIAMLLVLSGLSFSLYRSSFTVLWMTKGMAFLASGALGGYIGAVLRERRRRIRR